MVVGYGSFTSLRVKHPIDNLTGNEKAELNTVFVFKRTIGDRLL